METQSCRAIRHGRREDTAIQAVEAPSRPAHIARTQEVIILKRQDFSLLQAFRRLRITTVLVLGRLCWKVLFPPPTNTNQSSRQTHMHRTHTHVRTYTHTRARLKQAITTESTHPQVHQIQEVYYAQQMLINNILWRPPFEVCRWYSFRSHLLQPRMSPRLVDEHPWPCILCAYFSVTWDDRATSFSRRVLAPSVITAPTQ